MEQKKPTERTENDMESDLDQESREGSLRRGHLRKDLKEVRGQMGEHCRQREEQVESPGVRECLNLEGQQVHTAVWWERRCGRTLRIEMRQVGTGANVPEHCESIRGPCLLFQDKWEPQRGS